MGVTNTAVLANGEYFHLPKLTDQEEQHLIRLEQRIKQKKRGSINHWRARLAYQQYLVKLRRRKLDALELVLTDGLNRKGCPWASFSYELFTSLHRRGLTNYLTP